MTVALTSQADLLALIAGDREDRMALVQHTSQYKFAYQVRSSSATRPFGGLAG